MTKTDDLKKAIREKVFVRPPQVRIITTSSGEPKESSWLFDFRAILLEAKWLNTYAEIFWEKYAHKYPFQVAGLETAAIPLVAAIVMKSAERNTPVNGFFIRKSRKREGLMKQIEGTLTNDPVILVDDLINSGSSFKKQVDILETIGNRVSDIFAILAFRSDDAYAFAEQKNIAVSSLFGLPDFGLPYETSRDGTPRDIFNIVWKFSAPSPSFEHVVQKSTPVLGETVLYVGSDKGTFHALHQSSGEVAWTFETKKHPTGKGIFSSPALSSGIVYFGAYDGNVYALSANDGKVKWKFDDVDWIGSSPTLAPSLNLLFIGLEFGLFRKRGGIAALDLTTGKKVWEDRTPSLTHGSPLYIKEQNMVVVGSNDGIVYAYDAQSGEKKWQYQTGGDIKMRAAYDAEHELVLVASMDETLYALSLRTGLPAWAFQTGAGMYSSPLVREKRVYCSSLDKSLYAIDAATGKKLWEFQTGGRIFASPVFADGSIWIGSNDGRLYELDPETGKMRGFQQFTERVVTPLVHNPKTNRFFVTTVANETYCLERVQR